MYFVDNKEITDPRVNIALETYLVENKLVDEPILLFYINEPSIIIGRNQNTAEEVNQSYIDEKGIHVVRRMSGGGAVYHDLGNFSFCFIKDDDGSFRDFGKFTKPVIDALHKMGVSGAELQGRNDLLIDGKKFSGNAMYAKNGRMTAHGTILFDADLDAVTKALKPRKEKIESKGIKSVRSRVTNIKPYVSAQYQNMTTQEFRDSLLLEIFGVSSRDDVKEYHLTDKDWEGVYKIRDERFGNWDWNYGHSPQFSMACHHKFPFGLVEFKLNVSNGHIDDIKIFGDFFGLGDIVDVEAALRGTKFDKEHVQNVFDTIDVKKYFGNISSEELTQLLVFGTVE
ncbi:lipoate--protein ligase [Carnobacteriaceae bacterium zg-ZUI78]|uniref:lipoate--protein ligase n=1 Tax=Granulicatella sp. zg-84 TaxID=2678503 RepID=UPI0013C19224|nr:lipoate--protein ligase [Granulicatella sp. zg-84]MBS4749649.1 lipoate--protein ligase [Carnobacteriaceae bacterium zg-ZUI78]NEW66372.1 lipoate--protein ligase [Granulicatella sp. zg-84]QMI86455.1 lipoate--protein ligase [Carnobacteriaceae bacterium zg-84]